MKTYLSKEDYTARIVNATPAQLVVINYELVIDYIEKAKESVNDDKEFRQLLTKAIEFLKELMTSLDVSYSISLDLMELYLYVNKLIVKSTISKKFENLDEALTILTKMKDAFQIAGDKIPAETAAPAMQNAQQVYAGMTYGRGSGLNEMVDMDYNRGLKA